MRTRSQKAADAGASPLQTLQTENRVRKKPQKKAAAKSVPRLERTTSPPESPIPPPSQARRPRRQRPRPLKSPAALSRPLQRPRPGQLTKEELLEHIIKARDETVSGLSSAQDDAQDDAQGNPQGDAQGHAQGDAHTDNAQQREVATVHSPQSPQSLQSPPAAPVTPAIAPPATPKSTGWGFRSLFSTILPAVFKSPTPAPRTAPVPWAAPAPRTAPVPRAAPAPRTAPASAQQQRPVGPQEPQRQMRPVQEQQQPVQQQPQQQQHTASQQTPPSQQQRVLNSAEMDQIAAGIAPTPSRGPPRTTKSRLGVITPGPRLTRAHKTIVRTAVRNINPEYQELATAWANKTARDLTDVSPTIGSKRKQLEKPMKLKDVMDIPARRPWESEGSFGLLPEFFDESDSDEEVEAPGWYVVDQLVNEHPALKKRKTETTAQPHPIINTHGNSASSYDLQPRRSIVPSPMFDNPVVHHEGRNIFAESQTQKAAKEGDAEKEAARRAAFEKELRRTGHVEGSGSFCVPEGSSDEEDEDTEDENEASSAEQTNKEKPGQSKQDKSGQPNKENSQPWTQKPPPPPVPAHAKLPVPLDASPSVPDMQREGRNRFDPVEAQRAKALKHTPAKKSRLREVIMPSPSVQSDAGSSPAVQAQSPHGKNGRDQGTRSTVRSLDFGAQKVDDATIMATTYNGIPEESLLDLDPMVLDAAWELVAKAEMAFSVDRPYGGPSVLYVYDEDDEASDEDDE